LLVKVNVAYVFVNVVHFFVNGYRVGFGCGDLDLDLGCGEVLWISGKVVGFCYGMRLWRSCGEWLGLVETWILALRRVRNAAGGVRFAVSV
jgi:hypothetical protein